MNQKISMLCQIHAEQEIQFIHINCISDNILKCDECVLDEDLRSQELVLIDSCKRYIINKNGDQKNEDTSSSNNLNDNNDNTQQFIQNWPPFIDRNFLKKLKDNSFKNKKSNFQKGIINFYDQLEKEVLDSIHKLKKKALSELDDLQDEQQQSISNFYEQISNIQELKQIIEQFNGDQMLLNQNIIELMSKIYSESEQNNQKIQLLYEEYLENQNFMSFGFPQAVKQIVLELISNISFSRQYEEKKEERDDKEEINKQTEQQLEANTNKKEIKFQYKPLISFLNKFLKKFQSNFISKEGDTDCFKEYFNNICENISQYDQQLKRQGIFETKEFIQDIELNKLNNYYTSDLDLCSHFNSYLEKIFQVNSQMMQLPKSQIDDIISLIEKMISQRVSNNNNIQQYINTLLQQDKIFNEQNGHLISEIISKYPIFNIENCKRFKEVQFKFNNFYSSDEGLIIKNNEKENNTEITIAKQFKVNAWMDQSLDIKKKYIIRFSFNLPLKQMEPLKIGICNLKDDETYKAYYLSSSESENLFKTQGKKLSEVTENVVNQVEMRICIEEDILIFTDYPYYSNYNCYEKNSNYNANNFDKNLTYAIFIKAKKANIERKINIFNFIEVDEFPAF